MKDKWIKSLLMVGLVFTLTACAARGPFTDDAMGSTSPDLMIEELLKEPESHLGKRVIIGGTVIQTLAREVEGKKMTDVEVLEVPLERDTRPGSIDSTRGRFILRYEGFRDPIIYAQGKEITAVAEVGGTVSGTVNGGEYLYPLLIAVEDKVWKERGSRSPSFSIGVGFIGAF